MFIALFGLVLLGRKVNSQTTNATDFCLTNEANATTTAPISVFQSRLQADPVNYLCLLNYPKNSHCEQWRVAPLVILTNPDTVEKNTLAIQQFLRTVTEYCGQGSYMMPFLPTFMNRDCKTYQFGNSSNWVTHLVTPNNTLVPASKDPVQIFEDMIEAMYGCTTQSLEEATAGAVFIFSDFSCEPLCQSSTFVDVINTLIINTSTTKYVTSAYFLGDYSENEQVCLGVLLFFCNLFKRQICNTQFYSDLDLFVDTAHQEHTCALADVTDLRENGRNDTAIILGIVIPIVIITVLVMITVVILIRRRSRKTWFRFWWEHSKGDPGGTRHRVADMNEYYDSSNQKRDKWELNAKRLEINETDFLGHGAFAVVYKGTLHDWVPLLSMNPSLSTLIEGKVSSGHEVAVKRLPNHADDQARSDFLKELDFMKTLGFHPHVISLLGCVSNRFDPMIVAEYCAHGDLLQFLRKNKGTFLPDGYVQQPVPGMLTLTSKDLLSFSWQISDGMVYLSSKSILHRDLAARNILLTSKLMVKIGDFGLCRATDTALYTTQGGRLPIKWMAIESLKFYEYTTKSDVWSYAVLLFEIFTFGETPYQTVQPMEMVLHLESGNRLEKTEHCPVEIYQIMEKCWLREPERRPDFTEIRSDLGAILTARDTAYGYLKLDNRFSTDEEYLDPGEVEI